MDNVWQHTCTTGPAAARAQDGHHHRVPFERCETNCETTALMPRMAHGQVVSRYPTPGLSNIHKHNYRGFCDELKHLNCPLGLS
eukprot:2173421-Amphidinium_carterae.1